MLLCSLSNDMSTDNIRVVYGLGVKGAAIAAVIWIITIPQTYNLSGIFDILLVLHCCCALLFSAAAIAFSLSIDAASGIRIVFNIYVILL